MCEIKKVKYSNTNSLWLAFELPGNPDVFNPSALNLPD